MMKKLAVIFGTAGITTFFIACGFYDDIELFRILGMMCFCCFGLCAVAGHIVSEAKRKRTRCAGKPNESQKVRSNKDLTIIIHRVLGEVKAGDKLDF